MLIKCEKQLRIIPTYLNIMFGNKIYSIDCVHVDINKKKLNFSFIQLQSAQQPMQQRLFFFKNANWNKFCVDELPLLDSWL